MTAYESASTEADKQNIKNFVEQLCTPPPIPQSSIDEKVAKYPNKAPSKVLARMTALEAANMRTKIAQEIQAFRMKTCRGDARYSNFQFATRSNAPTVTSFVQSMPNIMTTQAKGELRYGMAPPSSCDRALKKLLGDVEGNAAGDR